MRECYIIKQRSEKSHIWESWKYQAIADKIEVDNTKEIYKTGLHEDLTGLAKELATKYIPPNGDFILKATDERKILIENNRVTQESLVSDDDLARLIQLILHHHTNK